MLRLSEKIGYGLGDMASSTFWKIFTAYLPFFYAQVFHLSLTATGVLMLVTRIWDAVSDPMMGIVADRTQTRWGKYRPYLLWVALPFAVAGVLLFTDPGMGETGKTVWAFATYILMMTVYTAINVPYGSMLGVMTDDSDEKTVFSSYRMFFAYGGSFIILAVWEPLCKGLGQLLGSPSAQAAYLNPSAWQAAMIVVGLYVAVLFVLTFLLTREHIQTQPKQTSVGADLRSLLHNSPWWILLGGVLTMNFFNAIRYSAIPFFFASVVPADAELNFLSWHFLFYAGFFLAVGEVANMAGVACTPALTRRFGKKTSFIASLLIIAVLCSLFFFIPTHTATGYWLMLAVQVAFCILTGVISPLIWSMYADISDYAELKFHTASTGLIFSSSSMAQKFGGALGGAGVMWLLQAFGYDTAEGVVHQTPEAIEGIRYLMSFIPAAIAIVSALFIAAYPLTTKRMRQIDSELKGLRIGISANSEM